MPTHRHLTYFAVFDLLKRILGDPDKIYRDGDSAKWETDTGYIFRIQTSLGDRYEFQVNREDKGSLSSYKVWFNHESLDKLKDILSVVPFLDLDMEEPIPPTLRALPEDKPEPKKDDFDWGKYTGTSTIKKIKASDIYMMAKAYEQGVYGLLI